MFKMIHEKWSRSTRTQRTRYSGRECTTDVELMNGQQENSGYGVVERILLDGLDANCIETITSPLACGLVSARDGRRHCGTLFPEALWLANDHIESSLLHAKFGSLVSSGMETGEVRRVRIAMLENRGIIIMGNSMHAVGKQRARIVDTLKSIYGRSGIGLSLHTNNEPGSPGIEAVIRHLFGRNAEALVSTGLFVYPQGDLIKRELNSITVPFSAPLSLANIEKYADRYGGYPTVVVAGDRIYGLGETGQKARAALDFAMESALVVQLAEAFGGVNYLPGSCGGPIKDAA
jgi:hypothetical protein